jgi:hypothetical protein
MNKKLTPEQVKERLIMVIKGIALGLTTALMVIKFVWTKAQVRNMRAMLYELTGLETEREVTIYAVKMGYVTQAEVDGTVPETDAI